MEKEKFIERGGIRFYKLHEARDEVVRLLTSGKKILGIDVFVIGESTTQPVSALSLDLSPIASVTESGTSALEHLNSLKNKDVWVEIVY